MDFPPHHPRARPSLTLPQTTSQPLASTSEAIPSPPLSARPYVKNAPSSSSSTTSSAKGDIDDEDDEISKELARLEGLRQHMKENLELRPLGNAYLSAPGPSFSSTSPSNDGPEAFSLNSNLDSHPPTAIRRTFQGLPLTLKSDSLASSNGLTDSSGDTASTGTMSTPQSPTSSEEGSPILYTAISPSHHQLQHGPLIPPSLHSPSDIISHYADTDDSPYVAALETTGAPNTNTNTNAHAQPLSVGALLARLVDQTGVPNAQPPLLLLDARPTGSFQEQRLKGSVNLAIPTLILKRWKKYLEKDSKAGQVALVQAIGEDVSGFRGFVATEGCKLEWDRIFGREGEGRSKKWNGDVVVYDEDMDEGDPLAPTSTTGSSSATGQMQVKANPTSPGPQQLLPPSSTPTTSWLLISILSSLAASSPTGSPRQVFWLRGGFAAAQRDPALRAKKWLVSGPAEVDGGDGLIPRREEDDTRYYTSSPTEMEAPHHLPALPQQKQPQPTASNNAHSLSIPSLQSPTSARQRAASTSVIPSPSTSHPAMFHGGGAATTNTNASGFKARGGGLLTLKTDVKLPRSKSKQRTQIDVGPVDESAASPAKENVKPPSRSTSSEVGGGGLAPPSRSASNDGNTPTAQSHSPLPPHPLGSLRKPSPVNRITGNSNNGPSYSYSSMYSEASPSPSPSTTTANLPFPRSPNSAGVNHVATSGVGGGTASGSGSSPSPGGGFLRNRSNTAMLPKLARLDTKTSRERLLLAPINTNLASSGKTPTFPPPPPVPPLNTNTNNTTSTTTSTSTNSENASTDQAQPGMPPKLSLRTTPLVKAATLAAPIASPKVSGFGLKLNLPPSPNRAAFNAAVAATSPTQDFKSPLSGTSVYFSPVQTPSEVARQYPFTPVESTYHSNAGGFQYASFASLPLRSPGLGVHGQQPSSPTTPLTARPPPSPAMSSALTSESEGAIPPFVISTIVPGFLYLGPEMSTEENVEELKGFGVKRILNMAIECEPDDYGLELDKRFERYNRIGMRDTVEEDRMSKALKEVCELLDDARLHSAPTYVHCKAGKSRSVTAVMAYLIHANHWTLGSAYKYVVDRRKGVSPNIGFVSELMNFEEQKLGTKSIGVTADMASPSADVVLPPPPASVPARVRAAHARDSLPPLFHTQSMGEVMSQIGVPVTAGGLGGAAVGAGAGEELEVRDEDGRYRHARRAPKNEVTLQQPRRVSKAGLESLSV